MLGSVGFYLRPIQSYVTKFYQPCLLAQLQHLHRRFGTFIGFGRDPRITTGWLVTRFLTLYMKKPGLLPHLKKCFKYSEMPTSTWPGSTSPSLCCNLWLTPSVNHG